MEIQIINIVLRILSAILGAIIVMVIHEFTKTIAFTATSGYGSNQDKINIFKLHRYIDPVGIIFCVTCFAGFSKPFPYRLKNKRSNMVVGIVGFLTLAIVAGLCRWGYGVLSVSLFPFYIQGMAAQQMVQFILWTVRYMFIFSITMFVVNLVPLLTSDISMIIIALSPGRLINLAANDASLKALLVLALMFGVGQIIESYVINLL